jgi:hypothetical protein
MAGGFRAAGGHVRNDDCPDQRPNHPQRESHGVTSYAHRNSEDAEVISRGYFPARFALLGISPGPRFLHAAHAREFCKVGVGRVFPTAEKSLLTQMY